MDEMHWLKGVEKEHQRQEEEHKRVCLPKIERLQQERAVWAAAWPKYCKTCEGWGGNSYCYDPSPAGVSLGSGCYEEYDNCPDCSEKGKCPRCGKRAWNWDKDSDDTPCRHCGWNWSRNKEDTIPPPYECEHLMIL